MSPAVSVRLLLSQSDERLVGYARAGHERAFEALVQRYRRQLLAYCRRLLLSEQRAEDALQQALLQAWVALRNGSDVKEPQAWLYRIVHNAAVQNLRVSHYDYCQLSESLSGADAPEADLDRRIAVREALAGLAALPEMQREALLRTALEGRTHEQTAADLGLSEPAVRGLVYRARASLRAATSAIVPPPLIGWALEAGTSGTPALERVAELGGAGGSAGLAGLLLKGGAVAVTAGALAGGIVVKHAHPAGTRHPLITGADRTVATRSAGAATTQPVVFRRLERAPPRRPNGDGVPARAPQKPSARHTHHHHLPATRQTPPYGPPAPIPNWIPPIGDPTPHRDGTFAHVNDADTDPDRHNNRPNGNEQQNATSGKDAERQSSSGTSEARHSTDSPANGEYEERQKDASASTSRHEDRSNASESSQQQNR